MFCGFSKYYQVPILYDTTSCTFTSIRRRKINKFDSMNARAVYLN